MQLDLFDVLYNDFKFDKSKPVRLVESFAGIGTQHMAFKKLGIEVEVTAIIEVDKFALLSYAAMHTEYLEIRGGYYKDKDLSIDFMLKFLQEKNIGYDFKKNRHTITERNNIEIIRDYYLACILTNNLGDISKVKGKDFPKGIDMFTYSFPCTDLSKAGEQKGLVGTRSGLVYEVFRIIEELKEINNKPKTLIMENVVDLIQRKFVKEFHEMQYDVENLGYINYTFVMNAKDFGVAQNRNRVFMLSLPKNTNYKAPKPFPLEKRLKDYLETDVDESYYLSDTFIKGMQKNSSDKYDRATRFKEAVKEVKDWDYSTTITTREGNVATSTFIKIPEATTRGYKEAYDGDGVYINRPHQKRGVVQKGMIQTLKTSGNDAGVVVKADGLYLHDSERFQKEPLKGLSRCLKANKHDAGVVVKDIPICLNSKVDGKQPSLQDRIYSDKGTMPAITTGFHPSVENNLRIRKLTPLECYRLMGIEDKDFEKAQSVTSNAQLYKQAGNAIVVDVFANLIKSMI